MDGFRKMLEGKLNDKKNNVAKVNNIVMMIGKEADEKMSNGNIRKTGINCRRWEFFKKSQEQVKRCKKPIRDNTLKASIKFRAINPESTFATIERATGFE